jgi:uncharacterized membrane protein
LTPLILGISLLVWIWGIIIVKLHGYIGRLSRVSSKTSRNTWKFWVIATGLVISIFTLLQFNGVKFSDLNLELEPVKALKVNPVLSFFFV